MTEISRSARIKQKVIVNIAAWHEKKKLFFLLMVFLLGSLIWLAPTPQALDPKAWHLFAIFVGTIFCIILKPLPIGATAVVAMCIATLTGTLTLEETLSGFHNDISWLVVFAFFISRGFIKTGLGSRIAYHFVSFFGKRTLSLSYSLLATEFLLSPAIPSVTARTGGVIYPIVSGLAKSFGSDPIQGTNRRIGSFLMKVAYQGSVITSAMFLTAMAANPLLSGLIQDAGFSLSWGKWALAACFPGIISLIVMPLIIYLLYPPEVKQTPGATEIARKKLEEMGKLKKDEWIMMGIFMLLLILWVFGSFFGIKATVAAMIGLSLVLIFNVLSWSDITKEENAWDTFIWFSTLITLATFLNKLGFTPWLSDQVVGLVGGFHWIPAFAMLGFIYFYSHYFFASNTAHVGAMFPAFLMVAIGFGTPPVFAILALAFCSSLFGGLTHYGSGPAPIYYGSGYVDVKTWWGLGLVMSLVNLVIWIGLGSLWWKILGLW